MIHLFKTCMITAFILGLTWSARKRKANAVCNTCSLQTKLELLLN